MIRLVLFFACLVGVCAFRIAKLPRPCGTEASSSLIHRNPWVVYLEYWRGSYLTDIRCTATLIDERHLVTAAHCLRTPKYSKLVARLGEYDLTEAVDCVRGVCSPKPLRIEIVEEIVHQDYDGRDHDIAILRLAEEVPYTDFIRPVCLPTGELQPKITFAASGWGELPSTSRYSTIKKIVPLPLWEHKDCVAAYKNYKVPEHMICAGGEEGIDTCRGDSGGPLVWMKDRIEIWGITSAGNIKCGTKGSPGLYTNVAEHLEWIATVIEMVEARDKA